MDSIMDSLEDFFTDMLRDSIKGMLENMFSMMDSVVLYASDELEKNPESWNSGIFSLIREISINAIAPIAVIILTLVVCYDFLSRFMDKSSRDMDIEVVAKLCLKLSIGIYLLNHCFDFTMGVFAMGQKAVTYATGTILGTTAHMDFNLYSTFESQMEKLSLGGLFGVLLIIIIMEIISVVSVILIMVITTSRMIEIYIYTSAAPIPFATLTNREWSNVGNNYIKNLFALSFQAFFMMVVVGLYNALINNIVVSETESITWTLSKCMGLSVILVLMLWKCGSISKSVFNAM